MTVTIKIDIYDLKYLKLLGKDFDNVELFCLSQDSNSRIIESIKCLEWRKGLVELIKDFLKDLRLIEVADWLAQVHLRH
jgi:hypothetical protein